MTINVRGKNQVIQRENKVRFSSYMTKNQRTAAMWAVAVLLIVTLGGISIGLSLAPTCPLCPCGVSIQSAVKTGGLIEVK